jgi:hypothetical protein
MSLAPNTRLGRYEIRSQIGAGGMGKTRLAVEAGRALLGDFQDGVFAVDLSPLSNPELVASPVRRRSAWRSRPWARSRTRSRATSRGGGCYSCSTTSSTF